MNRDAEIENLRAEVDTLRTALGAATKNLREAWLAIRSLREEVERRSDGMVAAEDTGPTFAEEAEQIAHGVEQIYQRALAAERHLKDPKNRKM
jgi:chromosome segregation ATPase